MTQFKVHNCYPQATDLHLRNSHLRIWKKKLRYLALPVYTETHDKFSSATFQSNLLVSPNFENDAADPRHPALTQNVVHHAEIFQENVSGRCSSSYKIPTSCVMEHGGLHGSPGLPPALSRVPAWLPSLMNRFGGMNGKFIFSKTR